MKVNINNQMGRVCPTTTSGQLQCDLSPSQADTSCETTQRPSVQNMTACNESGTSDPWKRAPKRDKHLETAIWELQCISEDRKLDLLFRGRLMVMLATLRLYNSNHELTWIEASKIAATAAGKGIHLARLARAWCRRYLDDNTCLPVNLYGSWKRSIINDEDFASEIQAHLTSLGKEYLSANDVRAYLNRPEVLARIGREKPVTLQTANVWLHAMGYRYGKAPSGMYIDGHERKDVVEYRQDVFLPLWSKLEEHMVLPFSDSSHLSRGHCEGVYLLVTHDESTFYANDQRKTVWYHKDATPKPRVKGEGLSLMVSDFCIPEIGWLKSEDG